MALNLTDIKRLKAAKTYEIESAQRIVDANQRDLEAIERVEAMLLEEAHNTSRSNGRVTRKTRTKSFDIGDAPPSVNNGSGRDLRGLVLAVLQEAKSTGQYLRARDIVEGCKIKGYPFISDRNAMGSVTKVLTRLFRKGLVEKTEEGYSRM